MINIVKTHKYWRFVEGIPGGITLFLLIAPIILSIFKPIWVSIFITLYATMWLFRSIRLTINLAISYTRSKQTLKTNWLKMIMYNDTPNKLDYDIKALKKHKNFDTKKYEELINLKKQIEKLQSINQYKTSESIVHAVIYVTYKESYELIRESIKSYAENTYDTKKIIIVFSGEEKDQKNALSYAKKLESEFGNKFMDFITTIHPFGLPNEIPGKSSNATWGAKRLKNYLDEKHIKYENVVISNFDADTVTHENYFAELTYLYLTNENRETKTYQPMHFYHNNIWSVPMFIRLTVLGCTFWRMADSVDLKIYKSFSSRSMSMQMAIDTDYWDPAVIPEDSRQYWTYYFLSNGKHELVRIESPLYMDAVSANTYKETLSEQYKQLRRWAYGVCDLPFVYFNMRANKNIGIFEKIYQIFFLMENHIMWSTAPIIITFTGWLPGMLNSDFRNTVMAYNLPQIISFLLSIAAIGVIACAVMTFIFIPRPKNKPFLSYLGLLFQWLFIPLASIFLSAIPAIEAQLRLLFNKKLEYQVAPKVRK